MPPSRRGARPHRALIAAGIVAGLLTPALAATGMTASAIPSGHTRTSVSCLPVPQQVTKEQATAVVSLAADKLGAASRGEPNRYPLGALRSQSTYLRTGPSAWTSGFFPGELWLMYEQTQQARWLDLARAWTASVLPMAANGGTHDLGFMVGIPTSQGARLDPRSAAKSTYLLAETKAARTLARRWNGRVEAMKSADYAGRWGVIVDSAMNAPMLIDVGQRMGGAEGERLMAIGVGHMRTLARDFVRADGSTFHRMAYNPTTGRLIGPIPGQGFNARTSTWARGQAWAIAGFAQAYDLTGDPQFLDTAQRAARSWVDHVPAGCVPAWDLDIDNSRAPRDSSAVAIAAAGMLQLAEAMHRWQDASGPDGSTSASPSPAPTDAGWLSATALASYARYALGTLASPQWTTAHSVNPGILLQQTYSVPADPRDGSYVWGDYYLLQALRWAQFDQVTPTSPVGPAVPITALTGMIVPVLATG